MSAVPADLKPKPTRRRAGVFPPIPEKLKEASDVLRTKETAYENALNAFEAGAGELRTIQAEIRALESDEKRALVVLGDAEARGEDTREARESLDSVRARWGLCRKQQETMNKDQLARRRMLEVIEADRLQAQSDYVSLRSAYQQSALREHEERELPKVQKAIQEYLIMRRALAGSYRPRDSQWWFTHIMGGMDFKLQIDQIGAVKQAMEDFVRGE